MESAYQKGHGNGALERSVYACVLSLVLSKEERRTITTVIGTSVDFFLNNTPHNISISIYVSKCPSITSLMYLNKYLSKYIEDAMNLVNS